MSRLSVLLIFVGYLLTGCSTRPSETPTATSTPPVERTAPRSEERSLRLTGLVIRVSDGDTITLLDEDNIKKRIRLQGIDAPEKGQQYTTASRRNLESLVGQKQVTIEYDKLDRYNRIVAKVYVDNQDAGLKLDVSLEQIRAGLAWHYKYFENEQTAEDRKAYAEAEEQARLAKRGLWQEPNPVPPWTAKTRTRDTRGEDFSQ